MNFTNFPGDVQNFSIILQSYAFDSSFLQLSYAGVETTVNPEYSETSISLNSVWTYNYFTVYISEYLTPTASDPNRMYSTAYINLSFTRQEFGKQSNYYFIFSLYN